MSESDFPQHVAFESVACDFCDSMGAQLVLEGRDLLHGLPGTFRLVQCENCGIMRQDPRPTKEAIEAYYPADYEPYVLAIDDEPSWVRRLDRRYGMAKRCRAISRLKPLGRLLDVGCATGNFLHEMTRWGSWEVVGIEPNEEAAAYARQRYGLEIYAGTLEEIDLPPSSFDVITMWNVLEHLHTPHADLVRVRRLLKDGAWLVFSIPNLDSVDAKWFGPAWLGWDLPRHLYQFPRRALVDSLARLGFAVGGWRCLGGNFDAFMISARLYLESSSSPAVRRLSWLPQALRTSLVRLLTSPLLKLLERRNLATIVTVFAHKLPGTAAGPNGKT